MKVFAIYRKNLKKFFKITTVKVVFVSFFTFLILIAITALSLWFFRDEISKYFSNNYLEKSDVLSNPNLVVGGLEKETNPLKEENPKIEKENDTVITAVKKARPAVVSIIGYKEVAKYDISYKTTDIISGVSIKTPTYTKNGTEQKEVSSCSGFIISSSGLIVTNRHVVSTTELEYKVLLNNGKEYTAQILAKDPVLDVALIKIEATGLPYLNLGNSDSLEVGQSVIAIGNALGEFQNTVSVGVISDLSRSITAGSGSSGQTEYLDKVIQTDAAINPGNSGGPLLNIKGEVVGINVAVAQGSSSIGFSLPINSVKNAIDSVKKVEKIIRPYVGVRYVVIDDELKTENNLSVDYGILVQGGETISEPAVIPGSPAEKAGILEGDIILEIDGIKLDKNQSFLYIIRKKNVGDMIRMKILSKGIYKTVNIKLEAADDSQ